MVPHLRHLVDEHVAEGEPVRFVPSDELSDEIGSRHAFHGGVVFDRTGGLRPAKLHAGLARLALEAGARVVDGSAATRLEATGRGHRVHTARGVVAADHVIVATNASPTGSCPSWPDGWSRSVRSSWPPSPWLPRWWTDDPRRRMFVDTKNLLFYWHTPPTVACCLRRATVARPHVGGRGGPDYLTTAMRRIHPRWPTPRSPGSGQERGRHPRPDAPRRPDPWRLVRHGLQRLRGGPGHTSARAPAPARTVLGETPPPAFAELRHRRVPLHRLRRAYLPLVGEWFRYQNPP